jgi:hypothetical protein
MYFCNPNGGSRFLPHTPYPVPLEKGGIGYGGWGMGKRRYMLWAVYRSGYTELRTIVCAGATLRKVSKRKYRGNKLILNKLQPIWV